MKQSSSITFLRAIAVTFFVLGTTLSALPAAALAQAQPDCGAVTIQVYRGSNVIYRLPENLGQRLSVQPDDVLRVVSQGLPTEGRVEFTALMPFGARFTKSQPWSGLQPGQPYETDVNLADYTDFTRGAFDVEIAIYSGNEPLCVMTTTAAIDSFGGAAAIASTAATGVGAGVTALAVAQGASSANVKISTQVALKRRRRMGWRRLIPVIAWRKTIWATITGAITGIFAAIALQQTGQMVLDSATVTSGAATGGGISLGVNVAWGSLLSLLKSGGGPIDDEVEGAVDKVSDAIDDASNHGL